MFELYKNNDFIINYENLNKSSGFTHSLTVKNLTTNKTTGMWVDPTHTSTDAKLLDKILRLQQLKETLTQDSYEHEVACFIEKLIENGGYSSLEISCLMKETLSHHKDPKHLLETIKKVDLSYIRHADMERFEHIQEMRNAVAGFIKTLTEFICNLLVIPSDTPVTSILVQFNIYQNPIADEELNESKHEISSTI